MAVHSLPSNLLKDLAPEVLLVLKRISVMEKLSMNDILVLISRAALPYSCFSQNILLFCAHYFAQAATLSGHDAAGHGFGTETIKAVMTSLGGNTRSYELALLFENDRKIS